MCLLSEGEIHAARNEWADFERINRRAADLRIAALGPRHPDTQAVFDRLGQYYRDRWHAQFQSGQWQAADATLERAIAAAIQQYGAQDWRVRNLQLDQQYVKQFAALPTPDQQRLREADRLDEEADKLTRGFHYADAQDRLTRAAPGARGAAGAGSRSHCGPALRPGRSAAQARRLSRRGRHVSARLAAQEKGLGHLHPETAQSLAELGLLYARIGLPRQSIEHLQAARQIYAATKGTDNADYAWCTGNLGMSYFQTHNLAEAEPLLQEALGDFETSGVRGTAYANTLNNLAAVYEAMVRDDLAAELFLRASAIWRKRKDYLDFARCLDNRAGILRRHGDFKGAEPLNLAANQIFTLVLGPESATTARSCGNVAGLYYAWGKLDEAIRYQEQSLAAWRKNLSLIGAVESESGQIEAFGQFRVALDAYLSLAGKLNRPPGDLYRNVLSWKGEIFAQRRQLRIAGRRSKLKPLVDKLRRASGRLAAALFAEPDRADPAAWRQQLTRLADEHDRLERQLAAAAGVPPRAAVSPAALAAVLPEKCALVDVLEYGQFEPQQRDGQWLWNVDRRLVAFVVRPGRPLTKVDLGPSRPVADAVEDWRKACIGRRTNGEIAGAKSARWFGTPWSNHSMAPRRS